MLGWFKGLGSLKIASIASVAAMTMGFYAGQRWEKADRYKDAQEQIVALNTAFNQSIDSWNVPQVVNMGYMFAWAS